MNISSKVIIKKIDNISAVQLVNILNNDIKLLDELGCSKRKISQTNFIEYNSTWCKNTNSEVFSILLNNVAIGMISLSHQNLKKKTAQVGYWISSKYWGKGCMSQAFKQILHYARIKKFEYLSATIDKKNISSKKIWEKYSSKIQLMNNKYKVYMIL